MSENQSRAHQLLGDSAPNLTELTDDDLFGDVCARPGLSPRDRSLITVAASLSLDRNAQLKSHINRALDHGVMEEELVEVITQLAFNAGWPCAVNAVAALREVLKQRAQIESAQTDQEKEE